MSHPPTVGVVITTYNQGLKYLPALLRSLSEQTHEDHAVAVVVDGGDPETVAYLEREWPRVEVVTTAKPRGYAGAAQLGVSCSSGRYVALLNDDVELEPRWLELLVAELERDPRLGFITGKTLLYDEREVINETKQDLYTCGSFVPRGLLERDEGQWDRRLPAIAVSGSTVVYRRQAVETVGGFDEDYFLYCEDADLCLRMVLAGYRGLYIPEARAYHAWAATTGRASNYARFYVIRNTLITLLKDFPLPLLIASLPKIVLYQSHVLSVARGGGYDAAVRRAWRSFLGSLPSTLRKRRIVMRTRVLGNRDFEAFLLKGYPVSNAFTPLGVAEWVYRRLPGPLRRFASRLRRGLAASANTRDPEQER